MSSLSMMTFKATDGTYQTLPQRGGTRELDEGPVAVLQRMGRGRFSGFANPLVN